MDHLTENYDAVFFNVSSFLDPEVRTALGLVSKSSVALYPRLQADNTFWQKRFEELTGVEYLRDQQPGKTTWRWKVETLEIDDVVDLLLSPELLDIKIGHSMLTGGGVAPLESWEKNWIAQRALTRGDEEIIRYLASDPVFELEKLAEKALEEGIEHEEPTLSGTLTSHHDVINYGDLQTTYYEDIPISTAKLLLDLFRDVNIPSVILHAIQNQEIPVVAFYLRDPRALLTVHGQEYLERAWSEEKEDIFFYLLGLPEVHPPLGSLVTSGTKTKRKRCRSYGSTPRQPP